MKRSGPRRLRGALRRDGSSLALILALAVLVAALGAAAAFADEPEANPVPSSAEVAEAIEAGPGSVEPELTDPSAAEGVELRDLGRSEALEVMTGVFPGEVEAPAGVFDELQDATLLGPNVAVVPSEAESEAGEGEPAPETETLSAEEHPPSSPAQLANAALIDSTVPLEAEGPEGSPEPVDLSLAHVGGELEPKAPLVETRIPEDLGGEVELPGAGIGISLANAPERAATVTEKSVAFYPNVAENTDLAISPTPSGVETLTQIRGPESPTTQTYQLSLPAGAHLVATQAGGAEVLAGEEVLMSVEPPSALDAAGEAVPAELEVAGDSLKVHVQPPPGAKLPILVDPLFQTYEWAAKSTTKGICRNSFKEEESYSCNSREEWGYEVLEYPWGGLSHLTPSNNWGPAQPGIYVHAEGQQRSGDHATVLYTVPRYFKETPAPTSYIKSLKLSDVTWQALGKYASPYLFMGIWDSSLPGWVSSFSHSGQVEYGINEPAHVYEFSNQIAPPANEPDTHAKAAEVGIYDTEASAGSNATVYVGAATVELGDNEAPQKPLPTIQGKWVNQSAPPLAFTASDKGLGVYAMNASAEEVHRAGQAPPSWKALNGCVGVGDAACPVTWKSSESGHQALSYEPALLPNGYDYLSLTAEDPVGNKSASASEEVWVDHTAPSLALSGSLTEQASVGTKLPSYTLNYAATDGEDAVAEARPPFGSYGTGNGQLEYPGGIASDGKGHLWVADVMNNRLEEFSENGTFIRTAGSSGSTAGKLNQPAAVAVDPSGNVWVADMANNRIEEFKENGEFVTAIGKEVNKTKVETTGATEAEKNVCTAASGNVCKAGVAGSAQGQLTTPKGIATTAGGSIWVADTGNNRVQKFSPTGSFLNKISYLQSAADTLKEPAGIAVAPDGSLWVSDTGNNRLAEWNPSLAYVGQYGSKGSGEGQFNTPVGLAFATSGNLFVTDRGNNRIEELQSSGTYLRQFGTLGTGTGNLSSPGGVAVGAGNVLYVSDQNNNRIASWAHADQNPQSGAAKVEVKVDGSAAKTEAPGCSNKNCQISGSWTMNANSYPGGSHKVEVIATDGVGLTTTKTLNVETHGDDSAPSVALSGTMTEQASKGTTLPTYKLKAAATDPGSAEERKSGVASETIKLDGTVVDSSAPGCPSEGCSLTREWTLESSTKSAGSHKVEVIATDAAGHTTTKTLEIKIERDGTAPQIEFAGSLFEVPQGWVKQKSYEYIVLASDPKGYGVTSLQLKIDGSVVKSTTGTCSAGACEQFLWSTVNMAGYAGGAHKAELVATDGAGNVRKDTWTINVDPSGNVSNSEVVDTIEAAEATGSSEALKGEGAGEESLSLEPHEGALKAIGGSTPLTIEADPENGVRMEILEGGAFDDSSEEAAEEEAPDLVPITIKPTDTEATATEVIPGPEAGTGVAADTSGEVDTIVRPIYDGDLSFQTIRDKSAPETYSWTVGLEGGETLKLESPQYAEVYYQSGHPAFGISAEPASDAVGTAVPTELSVSEGNVLTLTVKHHSGSFVYPILAGAGWQGGFVEHHITGPKDEKELREERERLEKEEREALERGWTEAEGAGGSAAFWDKQLPDGSWLIVGTGPSIVGAPEYQEKGGATASGASAAILSRPFKAPACTKIQQGVQTPENEESKAGECKITKNLMARGWVHGHFHYEIPANRVWWDNGREGEIACNVDFLHSEEWIMWPKECHFSGINFQEGQGAHIVAKHFWRAETDNELLNHFEYEVICIPMFVDLYRNGYVGESQWWGGPGALRNVNFGDACPWPQ